MGCGASNDTSHVQAPTLKKKSVLPAIQPQTKTKTKLPSAKSNGSSDSGIEDTEPIKSNIYRFYFSVSIKLKLII